ncbi:MAG TPA: serine hydrolase [Telluria sp.]|nr:serine hydrolase [Telluria sp.]
MSKFASLCIASLLVLPQAPAIAQPGTTQQLDAALYPYFKADAPGATVIVVKDGKTLFRKAYGMADVSNGFAMQPGAQHRIASITKQFTSTAIMMLAEEGRLSVDDDITKHLPDFPTQGRKITIEHLLTHTSGIPSYSRGFTFFLTMWRDKSVADIIDSMKGEPLMFEPGTRYAYNNSGYFLLGAIIEKVSGLPYAKFVEQRIFTPLGMRDTAFEGYEKRKTLRAVGHTDGILPGYSSSWPLSMSQAYAAGALVSTVDDMARWDAAITSGKLLSAAGWQRAFTPYRLKDGSFTRYGYGWSLGDVQGSPKIGHGGAINGFLSYSLRLPQEKVYVAVLSNSDSGLPHAEMLAGRLTAIAIGRPYPAFKPVALPTTELDKFVGAYRVDADTVRTFSRSGDRLYMQRTGRDKLEVVPYGPDRFFVPDTLTHMQFVRDASGKASAVTVRQNFGSDTNPRGAAAAN